MLLFGRGGSTRHLHQVPILKSTFKCFFFMSAIRSSGLPILILMPIWYDHGMKTQENKFSGRQLLFKELFVGTLIYVVVLGFFNDYTNIVSASSFSTLFMAAFVLELLTCLAFLLKKRIIRWLKGRQGMFYRLLMFFCVWLVMFVSKFVFIWVIDFIFGSAITITGFFGILWLVLCVTIIHKLADKVFIHLGSKAL